MNISIFLQSGLLVFLMFSEAEKKKVTQKKRSGKRKDDEILSVYRKAPSTHIHVVLYQKFL
jgi:hypothetical protein